MIKILFLAANPIDRMQLSLGEESRAIDKALRQTEFRDRFDIKQHQAVRVGDIQECLLRHEPHIVHFSGHGSESSEIILQDNSERSYSVPSQALSNLFSVLKGNIQCVVLNACYSEQQARAIAEHIDCVVGISEKIHDQTAISFATAFYRALGYGRDVKTAFDLGCLEIHMENLGEQDKPKLLDIKNRAAKIRFADREDERLKSELPEGKTKMEQNITGSQGGTFIQAGGNVYQTVTEQKEIKELEGKLEEARQKLATVEDRLNKKEVSPGDKISVKTGDISGSKVVIAGGDVHYHK